jgi:NAD+ kinase
MSLKYRRVGLIGKYSDPVSGAALPSTRQNLLAVSQLLATLGCEVILERQSAINTGVSDFRVMTTEDLGRYCDVAVVIGGDGTMLGAARILAAYDLPLIGINQGRLGFITDIELGNFHAPLTNMIRGAVEEDRRTLIHGSLFRGGACLFDAVALNDVVVTRGSTSGMVELRVEIDGHFVANHRADGLIVATPTGATAYSLSAGGPLLHPSVPGWAMVPIAPHNLSNRPIVLADTGEIQLEIVSAREASASFDMQSITALQVGDRITVRRSAHQAVFLHETGWNYFDVLRRKLHWNARNG